MTSVDKTLPTLTRWSSDSPEDRFSVENPATGTTIASIQGGGAAQIDAAVRTAHQAYQVWRKRSARERGAILFEIARNVRAHADEIARLESEENGKPFTQARRLDLEFCIAGFEFFAGLVDKMPGQAFEFGPITATMFLEPFGVVGGIIPFNWPPIHFAGKVAPALAVGNALVLKPGEQAPLTVMRLAELAQEVLPDDVLHVVPGMAPAGAALAAHPLVRKLSFTGAPVTGARVLKAAADNLTPTLMELGGKNPLVVFADADLDLALAGPIEGGFFNQGEACTAASRILVHRSIHDRFVDALIPAVGRLRVGDGAEPETHVGPLVTSQHKQRVLEYLEIGRKEGARIAAQAPLPQDPRLRNGYFVPPTLLVGVRPEMRVAREEIFGPVICVIPFDDYEEAIEIANGTAFGLVAAVYTRNHELAMRASREIEAGIVFINNFNRNLLGTPFGGTKASGFGREHCIETLYEFGYRKAVRSPSGLGEIPRWFAVDEVLRKD